MPEGPEIRREAQRIADVIVGYQCEQVFFGLPALKTYQRQLKGQYVESVTARGKAMLITFGNGFTVYSHNQLYGRWLAFPYHHRPETNRQLRLAIDTQAGSALLYSASDISVWPTETIDHHPFLARLGPDILDECTDAPRIRAQLTDTRFHRRSLGVLLLTQDFIAGLGNYLRSEILFFAGLSPSRTPASLTNKEREALIHALKSVPKRSLQTQGITLSDAQLQEQQKAYTAYEDYRFAVFGRAGEPCISCRTVIQRATVGGRRLYFCEECQR